MSKQLGHSSVKVTLDTYAHLISRKRRVAEAKERGKDRWRDKFAKSTGGDRRLNPGADDSANVAFLHGSAAGGDR
ncbi:MAG: hypothetical protein M3R37_13815 [Actinomycetota bacterium]|nr:hypothetical protein [Actinomycetota bacterium]